MCFADSTYLWEGADAPPLMCSVLKDIVKANKLPAKKLDKYKKGPDLKKHSLSLYAVICSFLRTIATVLDAKMGRKA